MSPDVRTITKKKDAVLYTRVTEDTMKFLKQQAKAQDKSLAELVQAVFTRFKKHTKVKEHRASIKK